MDVPALLRSRNNCLKRFLALSEKFLANPSVKEGDLSELQAFESQRAGILKAYDLFNNKIDETLGQMPEEEKTEMKVEELKKYMLERDLLVKSISRVDERIIELIRNEMEKTERTISENRKSSGVMKRFKSDGTATQGKSLDRKL